MSEASPPTAYPAPPTVPSIERIRLAWQRRPETDYIAGFWSALGWTLLTCGFYGFYVFYQLMRRMRDHNQRRGELLDAATALAWEKAQEQGLDEELRPNFERIGAQMQVLAAMSRDFRDPWVWTALSLVGQGIVHLIAWVLLDGDLVKHDLAEGAVEAELSEIYGRLGAPVPPPDPGRIKGKHNYVARFIVLFVTIGIYGLWWQKNLMDEPNRHFQHNWAWEDGLAQAVQSL
jgi:hypothetical protein